MSKRLPYQKNPGDPAPGQKKFIPSKMIVDNLNSFIALDVETANRYRNSICQIAMVEYANGQEINAWDFHINPETDFHPTNVSIHHITPEKVKDCPTFQQLYPQLCAILSDKVVATYTNFDSSAIEHTCERYALQPPPIDWLDITLPVRHTWDNYAKDGFSLVNVTLDLGIKFSHHHDALADARAAGEVLCKVIQYTNNNLSELRFIAGFPVDTTVDNVPLPTVKRQGDQSGPLAGNVIVFTGELCMPRLHAAQLAAKLGCTVEEGVNKRTTILVVGCQDLTRLAGKDKSSKHIKAEQLIEKGQTIRIMTEEEFVQLAEI
jgi:DNA polymerase-3 subunit epsilon